MFVRFCSESYGQIVCFPAATNCVSLVADLFLGGGLLLLTCWYPVSGVVLDCIDS